MLKVKCKSVFTIYLILAANTGDVKKNGQKIYDVVVGSETSLETKAGK